MVIRQLRYGLARKNRQGNGVVVVDARAWQATLEYWQTSGVQFLSGDRLEFSEKVCELTPAVVPPPVFSPTLRSPDRPNHHATRIRSSQTTRDEKNHTENKLILKSVAEEIMPSPLATSERLEKLKVLARQASECQKCDLHRTRNQVVFGAGSVEAPIVLVGEGPGADEDRMGEPFVGAAGKLLDKMIRAIGLTRQEVYIANVVKCRPPGNRNPLPEEMAQCQPFLVEQLQIIQPRVIFCLGKFSLVSLLGYNGTVGDARRRTFTWQGIPVMASFHPAYYLRTPGRKSEAWQDLVQLQKCLEQ